MKTYKVPIIIERHESLNIEAQTLDEAIQMVDEFTNRDIEKHLISPSSRMNDYPIPKHAHVDIDWDMVEEYNPVDRGV